MRGLPPRPWSSHEDSSARTLQSKRTFSAACSARPSKQQHKWALTGLRKKSALVLKSAGFQALVERRKRPIRSRRDGCTFSSYADSPSEIDAVAIRILVVRNRPELASEAPSAVPLPPAGNCAPSPTHPNAREFHCMHHCKTDSRFHAFHACPNFFLRIALCVNLRMLWNPICRRFCQN